MGEVTGGTDRTVRRVTLGIDTATVVCVGLAVDGEVVATAEVDDRMAHVEQLTPLVRRVCATAQVSVPELTEVVVGLGPGPYTGLRVGIITARVLADVAGARLHGVCSLDVIAAQHVADSGPAVSPSGEGPRPRSGDPLGEFVVATDARRREVYWARYASDGTRLAGPSVAKPADVPALPTVGPGADLHPEALAVAGGPRALDPATLVLAGPTFPDAGTQPLYLRRPDATEPGRRKSVLVRGPRR